MESDNRTEMELNRAPGRDEQSGSVLAQSKPSARRSRRRKREQVKKMAWLTEAQVVIGWIVILIMVALLGAIYLNQASRTASVGRRVQLLQEELDSLKRTNATLSRQIAEAQSLEELRQKAIQLGFVQARSGDIEYIMVDKYPAADSTRVAPAADVVSTVTAEPPQTMWEAIKRAFGAGVGGFVQGEASE